MGCPLRSTQVKVVKGVCAKNQSRNQLILDIGFTTSGKPLPRALIKKFNLTTYLLN